MDYIPKDPTEDLNVPNPKRAIPKRVDHRLIDKLFIEMGMMDKTYENMLCAAMICLFDAGMRRKEVCNLQLEQLDLKERIVTTKLKGGREGKYALTKIHQTFLEKYLKMRPTVNDSHVFIFKTHFGKWEMITEHFIVHKFYPFVEKLVGQKINPHSFRHNLAYSLTENGAPLDRVKDQLNHSSIMTTVIYAQGKNQIDTIDRYHPRG